VNISDLHKKTIIVNNGVHFSILGKMRYKNPEHVASNPIEYDKLCKHINSLIPY